MQSLRKSESIDLLRLGLNAQHQGDQENAIRAFQKSIQHDPRNPLAYQALGDILRLSGRVEEAIKSYLKGLSLAPNDKALLNNIAVAELLLNRVEQVALYCDRLLKLESHHPDGLAKKAWAILRQGKAEQAKIFISQSLSIKSDSAFAWTVLGDCHRQLQEYEAALHAFRHVLSLEPGSLDARTNLAILYTALSKGENAKLFLEDALNLNPHYVPAWIAWAQYCRAIGDLAEAEKAIQHALQLEPNNYDALTVRGFIRLHQGQYQEGWQDYTARHRKSDAPLLPLPNDLYWRGDKISGTLLLLKEQGIGDEIMFAGLFDEACALADHLIIECDPRLLDLFQRSFPEISFVTQGKKEKWDRWAFAGDICAALRKKPKDFLRTKKNYLRPDKQKATLLKQKYQKLFPGRPIIGISWKTKSVHTQWARSLSEGDLQRLLDLPNALFVSLQYGDKAFSSLSLYMDSEIDAWNDLDGLAAQVEACDYIITIDNSTAHLAGALGKDTHLLLPKGCDWRWMENRDESPWYPSLKLWRQNVVGDWRQPIENMKLEILERNNAPQRSPSQLFLSGRWEEVETALKFETDSPAHQFIKAQLALLEGDFVKGWGYYDARFAADPTTPLLRGPWKKWQGDWNKPLLIWGEQGLGEELLFSSLLPEALTRQRDIIFLCDPRLVSLFQRSIHGVTIIPRGEKIVRLDMEQAPIGDLAKYLRRDFSDFHDHPRSWIRPSGDRISHYREKYLHLAKGRKIVGLSWQSHNPHSGATRSRDPLHWIKGEEHFYVSLQYKPDFIPEGIYSDDTIDSGADIENWAAQIAAMDEIVTIDNSVANLAGAMGLPTKVFLSAVPDWRWMAAGEHTPWYPNITLVRSMLAKIDKDQIIEKLTEGKFIEACCLARQWIDQHPEDAQGWHLLGQALAKRGRPEEALRAIRCAGKLNPEDALIWLNIATVAEGEESENALAELERLAPNNPHLAKVKADIIRKKAAKEANTKLSLSMLIQAWRFHKNADILSDISAALFNDQNYKAAVKAARKALGFNPFHLKARQNLSAALLELGQVDEALQILEDGDLDEAMILHKVTALRAKGYFPEARRLLEKLPPKDEVLFAKAMLELNAGAYVRGWSYYKARFTRPQNRAEIAAFNAPEWQGEEVDSLLILAEQGLGDEIMFAAWLKEARHKVHRLYVEADIRLHPLYRASFPGIDFLPRGAPLLPMENIECKIALGDLPAIIRSIPKAEAYLKYDSAKAAVLRAKYQSLFPGRSLIGINWRSGNIKSGALRSIEPARWSRLLESNAHAFISLQYAPLSQDLFNFSRLSNSFFIDKESDPKNDLEFLSAQIQAMDLILSIDNSTAHLAGALGAKVILLLPDLCDWRWPFGATHSPWYSHMRLFRPERGLLSPKIMEGHHE